MTKLNKHQKEQLWSRYKLGDAQAAYLIAWEIQAGFQKDQYELMIRLYRDAASKGISEAAYCLAGFYDSEWIPEYYDLKKSFKWFKIAASMNHSSACNNLAYAYEKKNDLRNAVRWYRRSVELGDRLAQYNLGHLYAHGKGVRKNLKKALQYYLASKSNGHNIDYDIRKLKKEISARKD